MPRPFGFFVDSKSFGRKTYTQDGLNTNIPHGVRTYPAKNRAGVLVPNTYLVTFEDAQNGDYQDYVFLVDRRRTAGRHRSTGTPVARIDFQPAASTVATGLHRATAARPSPRPAAPAGSYPARSTPLDMTAHDPRPGGHADAQAAHADPDAAHRRPVARTDRARGSYTLPNGSYVVTVGVGDPGFADSTHRIQVEGQTVDHRASRRRRPTRSTTGTATVQVTDGALTIDAIGGTNTKIHVPRHRQGRPRAPTPPPRS